MVWRETLLQRISSLSDVHDLFSLHAQKYSQSLARSVQDYITSDVITVRQEQLRMTMRIAQMTLGDAPVCVIQKYVIINIAVRKVLYRLRRNIGSLRIFCVG